VANAGGRPIETPFGTVWTSNLTPDPETGLGRWSFAAFERAMRHGVSRDGRHLYPAFPYTSFAGMTEGDLMALWAYVRSLEPVVAEVPRARMLGPAALRPGMAVWNLAFHEATPLAEVPGRDAVWNRGRYLVETVGHCSACHSPRGLLGAEAGGARALTGAMVQGWWAPALAGPEAAARGWDEARLKDYLATGHAPELASAGGPMAAVAGNLAHLPEEDVAAMARYLASLIPEAAAAEPVAPVAMPDTRVHRIFEASCATCHEPAFDGMLTSARVPLGMTTSVRAPTSASVEAVIREGLGAPPGTDQRDMPGFGADLSEAQIAELARYVRARYAPDLAPWAVE
jgi:nicotinate dehydrogenase subunit B